MTMKKGLGIVLAIVLLTPGCDVMRAAKEARDVVAENRAQIASSVATITEIIRSAKELFERFRGTAEKLDIAKLTELATQLWAAKDQLQASMAELKAANKEAFAKADKDGDGKLGDIGEWLLYLIGGGGAAAEIARRLLNKAKADAVKVAVSGDDKQQAAIDALTAEIAELKKAP